ncbi:MAG: hypothetical protein ACKOFW_18250, partial [Planctomycetaceae bacterium]
PGAVAWLLTLVAGVEPAQRPRVTLALLAGLYPIVLMSALESNSPWIPLSRRVAVSLVRSPGVWLVFSLLATSLLALVGGLLWLVWRQQSLWLAVASGPVLSALLLIGARLFGRLAWKISDIESRWSRKRREAEVEQATSPLRPQPPRYAAPADRSRLTAAAAALERRPTTASRENSSSRPVQSLAPHLLRMPQALARTAAQRHVGSFSRIGVAVPNSWTPQRTWARSLHFVSHAGHFRGRWPLACGTGQSERLAPGAFPRRPAPRSEHALLVSGAGQA